MSNVYSLDEAATQITAIIARVREGETVAISDNGVPVAEIRPAPPAPETLTERLNRLEAEGVLLRPPPGPRPPLVPGEPRPGALARFLAERD